MSQSIKFGISLHDRSGLILEAASLHDGESHEMPDIFFEEVFNRFMESLKIGAVNLVGRRALREPVVRIGFWDLDGQFSLDFPKEFFVLLAKHGCRLEFDYNY